MKFAGIDVSKDKLNVAIIEPSWAGEFANSPDGHQKLVRALRKRCKNARVVVEPTASYHVRVATLIAETKGFEVMVANPRATRNFAVAISQRGKTDGTDAVMLARFGKAMTFVPWQPPSEATSRLRSVIRRRHQLVRQRTAEKVRLKEAIAVAGDSFVIDDIKATISFLSTRIKALEGRAVSHVAQHQELNEWREQLTTIPGIGDVTALTIMAEIISLPDDMDAKQLTAYAGLDPRPWQSGRMDAPRRISKRGNKRLRTSLFLAAWNASSFSPEVKAYKESLVGRGKAKNVANVAIARRLLHAIAGMRRNNQSWDGSRFYRTGRRS